MPVERPTLAEALGELQNVTIADLEDMLEGWWQYLETNPDAPRHTRHAAQIGQKTGAAAFVGYAPNAVEALLRAMALAVTAGELELPRVRRT